MKFHKKPKLVTRGEWALEGLSLVLDGLVQIFSFGNYQTTFYLNRGADRVRKVADRSKAKRK